MNKNQLLNTETLEAKANALVDRAVETTQPIDDVIDLKVLSEIAEMIQTESGFYLQSGLHPLFSAVI